MLISPSVILPVDGSNLLIAICKGKRSCIHHPISNFSYHSLSPSYHWFVVPSYSMFLPYNVKHTLVQPNWMDATSEEMNALEKWYYGTYGSSWRKTTYRMKIGVCCNVQNRRVSWQEQSKACTPRLYPNLLDRYQEPFTQVVKMNFICIFLSLSD